MNKENKMKKNMGSADRIIRLLVVLALAVLIFTGIIQGWLAIVLGIVAVVLLITSITSVCPAYFPFNVSTRKKEKEI
jgi:type IV secretory pathway TrbD component